MLGFPGLFATFSGPRLFTWTKSIIYEYSMMHIADPFVRIESGIGAISYGQCPGKNTRLVCGSRNGSVSLVAPASHKIITTMMFAPLPLCPFAPLEYSLIQSFAPLEYSLIQSFGMYPHISSFFMR